MQVALSEDVSRVLTEQLTDRWKHDGIHTKLTWVETHQLTEHFLKACRTQGVDYKEHDLYTLLDSNLNYYENRAAIDDALGFNEPDEKAMNDKLRDYFTEEQLAEYTTEEKDVIDQLEHDTENTRKKLNTVLKAQEKTKQESEDLKQEINRIKSKLDSQQYDDIKRVEEEYKKLEKVYDNTIVKLQGILDLEQKVDAMLKSKNFQDVGRALKPFCNAQPKMEPDTEPTMPIQKPTKPKRRLHILDLFAASMVTLIYLGITAGVFSTWQITWSTIIGVAVLWITYVVAVRVVAGGVLD